MLKEKAEKLLALYDAGYNIHYTSSYVDGNFSLQMSTIEGVGVTLSSHVFADLALSGLSRFDFTVSEDIDDWENHEV